MLDRFLLFLVLVLVLSLAVLVLVGCSMVTPAHVMLPFIEMLGHHRPCAGEAMTDSYQHSPKKLVCWGKAPTRRKVNSGGRPCSCQLLPPLG